MQENEVGEFIQASQYRKRKDAWLWLLYGRNVGWLWIARAH